VTDTKTDGDSHIVRPGSWFPICGAEPNANVTLPLDKVGDPNVLDAVEICTACIMAAGRGPKR